MFQNQVMFFKIMNKKTACPQFVSKIRFVNLFWILFLGIFNLTETKNDSKNDQSWQRRLFFGVENVYECTSTRKSNSFAIKRVNDSQKCFTSQKGPFTCKELLEFAHINDKTKQTPSPEFFLNIAVFDSYDELKSAISDSPIPCFELEEQIESSKSQVKIIRLIFKQNNEIKLTDALQEFYDFLDGRKKVFISHFDIDHIKLQAESEYFDHFKHKKQHFFSLKPGQVFTSGHHEALMRCLRSYPNRRFEVLIHFCTKNSLIFSQKFKSNFSMFYLKESQNRMYYSVLFIDKNQEKNKIYEYLFDDIVIEENNKSTNEIRNCCSEEKSEKNQPENVKIDDRMEVEDETQIETQNTHEKEENIGELKLNLNDHEYAEFSSNDESETIECEFHFFIPLLLSVFKNQRIDRFVNNQIAPFYENMDMYEMPVFIDEQHRLVQITGIISPPKFLITPDNICSFLKQNKTTNGQECILVEVTQLLLEKDLKFAEKFKTGELNTKISSLQFSSDKNKIILLPNGISTKEFLTFLFEIRCDLTVFGDICDVKHISFANMDSLQNSHKSKICLSILRSLLICVVPVLFCYFFVVYF